MNLEQIGGKIRGYLPAASQIADIADTIAAVIPGVGNVVGIIKLAIKVANGVANEIPQAIKALEALQEVRNGGKKMTTAELDELEASIDEAHNAFVVAANKVINKS